MNEKRDPLIIIVSAPSGSGKTSIVDRLIEKTSGIKRSISYTTRAPRKGEKEGEDYIFVSTEDFKERLNNGEFLEWEEVFGNYYGTSEEQLKEAVAGGEDIVLNIDVKGARTVKEKFPESISVFIMPPSMEELAGRLKKRNADKEKQMSVRLAEAQREMGSADEYDYMIVNKDLAKAEEELKAIIEAERANRRNSVCEEEKNGRTGT